MIERALAEFLQQGLSLHIGTRNEQLHPAGARAVAVTVDADGRHMDVYVPSVAAQRLLPDLQSNGQAAIGFGRPEDERACQVKGTVVSIRDAVPAEQDVVMRQWQGLAEQFEKIGIPRAVAAGWTCWPAVVVRIRVTAVFEQTPGPHAGVPLA